MTASLDRTCECGRIGDCDPENCPKPYGGAPLRKTLTEMAGATHDVQWNTWMIEEASAALPHLDALVARVKEAEAARDELAARLAEAERQRDEALASVVLYVNERDAARDGWEAQVRSEEREMRRRIEAEARADNLAPYVQRSQQFEARVAALTPALRKIEQTAQWYADNDSRLAHEVDHCLCVEIPALASEALAAADRPEGTCSWCDLHGSCDPPNCPKRADRPEGTPDALREAQDRAAAAEAHATVEAERLADELETANHFRDRLAERLEVVAVAVTELECALSFTNYANDPDHWRGHVESALEMCKRATRARADRTEGTTP